MRTIGFIIRKEFQQLRRDRRLLPLIFLSPVIQIALLGYAANMDVKDIPLAVCDQDHTVESRHSRRASWNQEATWQARTFLTSRAPNEALRKESPPLPSSSPDSEGSWRGQRRRRFSSWRTAPTRSPRQSG